MKKENFEENFGKLFLFGTFMLLCLFLDGSQQEKTQLRNLCQKLTAFGFHKFNKCIVCQEGFEIMGEDCFTLNGMAKTNNDKILQNFCIIMSNCRLKRKTLGALQIVFNDFFVE